MSLFRFKDAPPEVSSTPFSEFIRTASSEEKKVSGRNRPLADYEWLQYEGPVRRSPLAKWIDQNVDEASIKLWFDAFTTLRSALNADLGCSALPCYTADNDPELEQLPGTHAMSGSSLWVLTHPDLRRSARIHAFMEFFSTRLVATSKALIGKPAPTTARPKAEANACATLSLTSSRRSIARSAVEKKRAADLGGPREALGMILSAFLKLKRRVYDRVSVTSEPHCHSSSVSKCQGMVPHEFRPQSWRYAIASRCPAVCGNRGRRKAEQHRSIDCRRVAWEEGPFL